MEQRGALIQCNFRDVRYFVLECFEGKIGAFIEGLHKEFYEARHHEGKSELEDLAPKITVTYGKFVTDEV